MDEQALNDAYNLFTRQGYNGTIDQFKKLISTNSQALNDSYQIFRSKGYNGEIDNYKELIGLKKKTSSTVSTPDSQVGMEDLQDGFDFSPTIFEAPAVLTPKKQKEYIAEQKTKPAPVVETPTPDDIQPSITPTETLTVGPMGITGLQRTKDYKPAEEFKGKSAAYISGELLKTLGKGVVKFPADALETIAIGASAIDNLIAKTGLTEKTEASKLATYQAAQEYRKLIDEVVPTDKDIENGFWGQSANALGQMVPIILSGFTAGGAKAIATQAAKKGVKLQSIINYGKNLASRMATPQGGLTISQVAAPSYSQAKSEGATENEALTYAGLNALLSYPIEMLPVDGLFKRLDKALVGNKGVEILKRGVIGGSQEGITEGIQSVYENLSANQIYGTTKDFLEGTGNASAVGGTVGLITNALLTALLGRRARATTNEEIVELDKSIEDTKKKVEQINSNNERFIETINTLEQSKPRTLNYGSAEYNFIESPEGNLELAQDDITKEQAEGIIKNLSNTYKKIEFSVQEIEPEDPYQPTTYRVIGTPIKIETTVEAPEVTQQRVDRIAEIETALAPESTVVIEDAEKTKLQTELETLKSEQDAIQIQTAGQVPVLTEAGVGEEVPGGLTQAEPQGVAQEGVQEEVTDEGTQKVTPIASLQTQTEEEQLARMEEMFAEKEIPKAPPVSQGTSVTNKSALDQVKSKLKDTNKISIVDSAQKIITTLKSVLPNFDIIIHDNDDSYTASMGSINAPTESAGNFSYVKMPDGSYVGRIDINLNKANQRTVAHEVAHGVMLKAFGENIETFKTFKNRIASVLNDSSNKELSDFASQYAENDSYEEYLAELTAKLEQQEGKLSASTLQKIAAIINELVSNITNGTFTPFQDIKDTKDAVEFFKNISESMRKGEEISPANLKNIKKAVKELENKTANRVKKLGDLLGLDLGKPVSKPQLSNAPLPINTEVANGFDVLKKKFGETAAKAIRENIPFALDYSNEFAEFITNKIPVKEDVAFIVKNLSERIDGLFRLQSDKNIETVQVKNKTPEELSKKAGYVFHRPESENDILAFKKDFENGEVLCTYNDIEGRMQGHFIFWLRRNDAESVLPAKKITQEYLKDDSEGSSLWRGYLDAKGLKMPDGSYDISNLNASRQDPYGTSSMSVQIGRRGGNISIKNRYNHTVNNPDATFGNDLNTIIDGLNDAVFGIEGIPKKTSQELQLPDNITSDSKGRFFKYDQEIENVYFSQHGYVQNGDITLIDKSYQRMIDNFIFDSKNNTLKVITMSRPFIKDINNINFEKNKITVDSKDGKFEFELLNGLLNKLNSDIEFIGDNFLANNITLESVSLPNVKIISGTFLYKNKNLKSISLPNVKEIGSYFLATNIILENISLPNVKIIGSDFLKFNDNLESISLPNVIDIKEDFLYYNENLRSISLPNVQEIGSSFLRNNIALESISLPNVIEIDDYFIKENALLESASLPNVEKIGDSFLKLNRNLKNISLPNVKEIGDDFLASNSILKNILLPNVEIISNGFLDNNTALESIFLPNVEDIGDYFISRNQILNDIELPNVINIESSFLRSNNSLRSISLPNVIEIDDLFMTNNKNLDKISLPNVEIIGRSFLNDNENLKSISLPNIQEIGDYFMIHNESVERPPISKSQLINSNKNISRDTKSKIKSKAQIIGNNAQLSATVKFNLDVAKEMAKNKMSPLDIRIQTGWEKGFEGKWRYEIPDGEFKDLDIDDLKRETSEDGTVVRVAKLSDVFNAPDLYQAYPEIKNTKTVFKDLPPNELGSYNPSTNIITVNKDLYKNNKPEANLTMLHEMQHYIQTKELFEGGSNPSFAPIMMNFVVRDFKNKVNEQLKKYNDIKRFFPDDKNSIKNARELYKFTKERYSKINDLLLHKDEKSIKNAYKDIGKRFNILDLPSENFLQNKNADGWNLYSRVAGEVESRNVEYRNKLTPEQRRKTLLSETENIDREDQILFENKELLFTEDVNNMNQKYPVSKSQLTDANKISKLIKDARVQGFSESVIETFLQRKGLNAEQISAAMGKVIPTAGRVDLSEEMLPGYTKLMNKIDLLFSIEEPFKELVRMLKNSNEYINATDIQREKLVRDLRKKFRLKEKSAPLVQKIIGAIKDVAKITMSEKDLLKKQIKDLARGAKDAKNAWVKISSDLSKEIKALKTAGKITDGQVKDVIRKFSKVNMFSQKSIDSFIDYMTKVFANAEYAAKLSAAKSLKKDISRLSKDKNKNANLKDLGSKFIKINPSMVEDIDAYNDMASKIKEAINGSTIRLAKVNFADTVNIENATEYINKTIEAQDEMMRQQKADEIQDLMDVDVSDLSYEDMMLMLDSDKPITKYNEGIIRGAINKAFKVYSSIIKNTISTGKDPFTDEDVTFTKNEKRIVTAFMNMDLNQLEPKEALKAVDALVNFLQNNSIARMDTVVAEYNALVNSNKLVQDGVKARELKKYGFKGLGRYLAEQITTLPVLFEKMFPGVIRSSYVRNMMGLTKLFNESASSKTEAKNIVNDYIKNFYKKKANGEAFNTVENNIERNMAAALIRTVIGTEAQMQAEFDRRKEVLKESIAMLSEGNEQEVAKSILYQKVYDKLVGETRGFQKNQILENEVTNIQEVKDRVDKTNLEAIDFWIKNWGDRYDRFAEVSEGVYNTVLEKELNYTPDKYSLLSLDSEDINLDNEESAFNKNTGQEYKKSGTLNKVKQPGAKELRQSNRYLNLDFDQNMANLMQDALIDINTAASIKQVMAFLNSPNFRKIFPNQDDADIIKGNKKKKIVGRVQLYIDNLRSKNDFTTDALSSAMKKLDKVAALGVSYALGGIGQVPKQTFGVSVNTLFNSGSLPDLSILTNIDKMNFINNSGRDIANRGASSQTEIESINKLIEKAASSTGEKAMRLVEKINDFWLKQFLVKSDVFIAKASWLTYYEQSLKKQGIDTSGLDYKTHELNDKAADYASAQVGRQQNISDHDMAGKLFQNQEVFAKFIVKTVFAFASFRMNAASRLGADLTTINDKTSTKEDRIIALRSIAAVGPELAMFSLVSVGLTVLWGSFTKFISGDEEDEDELKKRIKLASKARLSSAPTDIFSPLPILDPFMQKYLAAPALDKIEDLTNLPVSIYDTPNNSGLFSDLGVLGIAGERILKIIELGKLAATGKYTDDYGNENTISEEKRKKLAMFVPFSILSSVGLLPQEFNTITMNAMKYAKSKTLGDTALARRALKDWASNVDLNEYPQVAEFIKNKGEELSGSREQTKKIKDRSNLKKSLLDGYESETQMQEVDPELYQKNFGEESDWVKNGYSTEDIIYSEFNSELNTMISELKTQELRKKKNN